MSITITRMALHPVAASDWDVVDSHLYRDRGDWVLLRSALIHLLCERVSDTHGPVTRVEELLLGQFYNAPSRRVTFLDALEIVRGEIRTWPPDVTALLERVLAQHPDFPAGPPVFPLTLDRLRQAAAADEPELPVRDLGRFTRPRPDSSGSPVDKGRLVLTRELS